MLAPRKENYDKPKQHIKKQRHHFADEGLYSQSYDFFPSSHVQMWELEQKEGWLLKSWCFVLEKTLESPLDSKEIKPVSPKENQSWTFTGGADVETKAPILWSPDVKSWLTGKDLDAGYKWGQEEKGAAKDEMVREHHWRNRHESEQTPGDSEEQGNLACCSPQGYKESDMT